MDKIQALARNLSIIEEDGTLEDGLITKVEYNDNEFEAEGGTYLVVTDSEADDLWDEELENYINDCILPEIPEAYQSYFDSESWKSDARMDGRGQALSSYDGNEEEETVNGVTYYIYRTN